MFTWCHLRLLRAGCLSIQVRSLKQGIYSQVKGCLLDHYLGDDSSTYRHIFDCLKLKEFADNNVVQLEFIDQDFKILRNADEKYPRITVPQKMVENLAKHNLRTAKEKAQRTRLKMTSDNLVLVSKRKEFNHYKGQTYKVFNPKKLTSYGWKHRSCPPDYFTIVASGKNPSTGMKDEMNFGDMKLDERILEFLEHEKMEKPTKVQSVMIPAMKTREHIACASETGSGKSYAYLIPCVQDILKRNDRYTEDESQKKNSPSVIVIVPTMELARQVKDFCDKMADCMPFHSVVVHGKSDNMQEVIKKVPMDILISTPSTLKNLIDLRRVSVSNLRTLVLDEADTLLDDSFNRIISSIFHRSGIDTSIAVQVVLVSATFPRDIDSILGQYVSADSFTKITTEHLHRISPHVSHKFVKMKSADKLENILTLLKSHKLRSTMIFCNNNDTCHWLSQTLKETGVYSLCLTGFHEPKERVEIYESFTDGYSKVLVCTDIASRGLDTTTVHHVVNFDFPTFSSDYIHRAGRVGRVGSTYSGQVTNFVVHRWDVDLVWKIEVAVRSGKEIHNVNANIKRKLEAMKEASMEEEDTPNDNFGHSKFERS